MWRITTGPPHYRYGKMWRTGRAKWMAIFADYETQRHPIFLAKTFKDMEKQVDRWERAHEYWPRSPLDARLTPLG